MKNTPLADRGRIERLKKMYYTIRDNRQDYPYMTDDDLEDFRKGIGIQIKKYKKNYGVEI